jgi:hypothetical protein
MASTSLVLNVVVATVAMDWQRLVDLIIAWKEQMRETKMRKTK